MYEKKAINERSAQKRAKLKEEKKIPIRKDAIVVIKAIFLLTLSSGKSFSRKILFFGRKTL